MKKIFLLTLILITVVIILILLLTWFGIKPKNTSSLVGTYDATSSFANEILVLDASGKFTQQVNFSASGKVVNTSGPWLYDSSDGTVCFENGFLFVMTGFQELSSDAEKPQTDAVVFDVRESRGNVYIGDDKFILYKRRKK